MALGAGMGLSTTPTSMATSSLGPMRGMTTPTKAKVILTSSGSPSSSRMTASTMKADARRS
eukprot:1494546-Heterocapsa_arctica.AAC.1